MKKALATLCLTLCGWSAGAQNATAADAADAATAAAAPDTAETKLTARINAFVDQWHDDAAHARPAYFDKIASDGVFIGTDKSELWHRDDFKVWAKPYFDSGKAWAFTVIKRHVYLSADRQYAWFDEQLHTQMGICQASGVIHQTAGGGLEIEHYQLSIAIPNPLAEQVVKTVKKFEAQADSK
ncbi:nuclear transport factor 2 family protein [Rugamonas sp.]|uniref:nuclear transport factor 2 family protein n=1 Tax=Rugamonas sp. TaxID=1926287 RepID=UPI0025F38FDE|nr:nuclear transport factor 2 family protein [Rugamonas sp.]